MRNFATGANISKPANASTLAAMNRKASGDKVVEIQELQVEEYRAVSGGPQVKNEPRVLDTQY